MKIFEKYCTPARIYLGISTISIIIIIIQNLLNKNSKELCVGSYSCPMENRILALLIKIVYILFWGWFLNFLCKKGLKKLSWFILLIPFLLSAVIVAGMMLNLNNKKTKEIIIITPN